MFSGASPNNLLCCEAEIQKYVEFFQDLIKYNDA